MDPLDTLFANALKGLHKGAAAADVDAYIHDESQGKIASLEELKAALQQRDATPGIGEGAARAAAEGASMGLGKVVNAGVDAGTAAITNRDPIAAFAESLRGERTAQENFRSAHPAIAIGSQVAGGLAPMLAGAGFAEAPAAVGGSSITNIAKAAGLGAAAGGVSGATNAPTLAELPAEVAKGAGAGAVLGTTGQVALGEVLPGVAGWARDLAGQAVNPVADAGRQMTRSLARTLPPDAAAKVAAMEATNPGQTLVADAAPELLDAAGRANTGVARAARAITNARNADAGTRLAAKAEGAAGFAGQDVKVAEAAALADKAPLRARTYAPLEQQFPRGSIPVKPPEVASIEVSPEVPGYESAKNTLMGAAGPNGEAAPELPLTPLQEAMKDPLIKGAYAKFAPADGSDPGFRDLQSTWMRLRNNGKAALKSGDLTVGGENGPEWFAAADKMKAAMEESVPGFADANKQWAVAKQVRDQYKVNVLGMDPRDLSKAVQALDQTNPAAAQALRLKGVDQLTSRLKDLGETGNAARQGTMRGNQDLESRLASLFPNQKALQTYLDAAETERQYRSTNTSADNSATMKRAGIDEQMGWGTSIGSGKTIGARLADFFQSKLTGDTKEIQGGEAGKMLLKQGPAASAEIQRINDVRQQILRHQRFTQGAGTILAPTAGQASSLWDQLLSH